MWLTRRDCAGLVLAGLAGPARGQTPASGYLGLAGFDPVSYFLPEGPQAGLATFEVSGAGWSWRFASAANRAVFLRDPTVYTPRLGGYDLVGILDGRLVDADPLVFALVDERLYLFRNAEHRDRVVAEPSLAAKAEASWPTLQGLTDGARE
ncbi:hypothetical protein AFCDBAGC_3776 [Methylobacterium cerastii]|uniref:YHS domain-containing protein n=1 Tax=Methylobacterium cerastii TaxID=932741 RepID=A0ABQ4QKV9_9HYPH|nr:MULTISPECIES: YHS domain-containing (seleno)protein [Methylobacterium]GJD45898.1 hypothetical protein AFCDBAGC_3776 [Methylobacterium cerastii]